MKVFHILYESLPRVSGSSIRSRDILISQKNIGIDVIAITSPFTNSTSQNEFDVINDINSVKNKAQALRDEMLKGGNTEQVGKALDKINEAVFWLTYART